MGIIAGGILAVDVDAFDDKDEIQTSDKIFITTSSELKTSRDYPLLELDKNAFYLKMRKLIETSQE